MELEVHETTTPAGALFHHASLMGAGMNEVELSAVDLRYEQCRVKNAAAENELLVEIGMRGIERPLCGVASGARWILLDGFKRLRCARKLHMTTVPCVPLGTDEAMGILEVLKGPGWKPLGFLEEARFLQELHAAHNMTLAEMAAALGRSKSWASMRLTALADMSDTVRDLVFRGSFPARAWMYIVRPFTRVNDVDEMAADSFVKAVSGRGLSTREIEFLAHGYFRGGEEIKREIDAGHVAMVLGQRRSTSAKAAGASQHERDCLRDLDSLSRVMRTLRARAYDPKLTSCSFRAQAHIQLTNILDHADEFINAMRRFHDRCRAS